MKRVKKRTRFCSDEEARTLICDIGKRMYNRGFVAASDGNVTIRVADEEVWVTPTGVSKSLLRPEMLVKTNLSGTVLQGTWEPTSELAMHLRVYREDDTIGSTCHAHSPFALAFACAGIEPDMAVAVEPLVLVGPVHIAPFAYPGTAELADAVAPYCKSNKVVLLANHGSLSWGVNPMDAWHGMEALEAYCKLSAILQFFPSESRLLGEDQIKRILFDHDYDDDRFGHQRGVPRSKNREPSARLSEILAIRHTDTAPGLMNSDFLDALATRVADKIIDRIASNRGPQ